MIMMVKMRRRKDRKFHQNLKSSKQSQRQNNKELRRDRMMRMKQSRIKPRLLGRGYCPWMLHVV